MLISWNLRGKGKVAKKELPQRIPSIYSYIREDLWVAFGIEKKMLHPCRLMIVVGDNCSGKSLFRRVFTVAMKIYGKKRGHDIEVMALSQELRSSEGMVKAFVYGSENWESTGAISAWNLCQGFSTSAGRDNPHVLLWDEPEIGLSEESQMGVGAFLLEQMVHLERYPNLLGLVLMTHSSYVVRALKELPDTCFLHIGKGGTVDEWLNRERKANDVVKIHELGSERFRHFQKVLTSSKAKKK